jgi:hypothetical protein
MRDRIVLDCPNAERCGGTVTFRAWTENTGDVLHPAYSTVMEDAGKTCRCDLSAEQWERLDEVSWRQYSEVAS